MLARGLEELESLTDTEEPLGAREGRSEEVQSQACVCRCPAHSLAVGPRLGRFSQS